VTGADRPPSSPPPLDPSQKARLLRVAADTVAAVLAGTEPRVPDPAGYEPPLRKPAATFVTLERNHRLLGCIGSLEPNRPLVASVAHHALAAAFSDPRLPAVTLDDFPTMGISVSHLGPLVPTGAHDYDELTAILHPGRDGILLDADGHQATFLPSVWKQVPDVDELLTQLWAKAGLGRRVWPPGTRVLRYVTAEFTDPGPRPAVNNSRPTPG